MPKGKEPEQYKQYLLSHEQNKDAPILPGAAIDMFMRGYQPDNDDDIWYATFNHRKGHAGIAPAVFQIAGMDPLRDEAIVYERVLREENGIKTKSFIYPGQPHGYWGFFPFLEASKKFRKEQVEGFGWLLGREPDWTNIETAAVASSV